MKINELRSYMKLLQGEFISIILALSLRRTSIVTHIGILFIQSLKIAIGAKWSTLVHLTVDAQKTIQNSGREKENKKIRVNRKGERKENMLRLEAN